MLGVRNALAEVAARQNAGNPADDTATLGTLRLVERSMGDWARAYPRDNWLPRFYAQLQCIYDRMPGQDARAATIATRLIADFPASSETRAMLAAMSAR